MDFVDFVVPQGWGNDFPQIAASINNQAHAALVPACALAAIVMRESGGRNIYQERMPHDSPDCGYGYCQITYGADRSDPNHPTYNVDGKTYDLFDPSSNLYVAAKGFLAPAITDMLNLRSSLGVGAMPQEILLYAFAAYNAGSYRVSQVIRAAGDPDSITTGGYGAATLAFYHTALAAAGN